ncbi:MAG TPA: PhzF family phenazine biosynthesis protein [bacterium]|nr:PhzF family phenazine biosynthesis protein [bacterium]
MTIYQVDAFTKEPFRGNPAGVCLLDAPADVKWMQAVAREMNLSETAFLYPVGDAFHLRWFTPAVEVDLCGHATLASTHVLHETGRMNEGREVRFETRSGTLIATKNGGRIEMDFPATPAREVAIPDGLFEAIGFTSPYVARNATDYLVVAKDADRVRACLPDFGRLKAITERGVIITARDDSGGYDFISRFFAPAAGIDEDPVTGSTHCTLGPYWGSVLEKSILRAFQASVRGGEMEVELSGDRVLLRGYAVTVMRCELIV